MKDPYFQSKGISQSGLKIFEKSPLHYKWSLTNPIVPTEAMKFGSLTHYVCFEEEIMFDYVAVFDDKHRPVPSADYRNKENQKWKANKITEIELSGKVAYLGVDYDRARTMRDRLHANPQSREVLFARGNIFESGTHWMKGKSQCKGKIDVKNEYFLADLKTAQDADPHAFHRTIFNMKYDRQGAMYLDGDAGGNLNFEDMKEYMIVAIEPEEPHAISVHRLRKEVIQYAYHDYCNLVNQLQTCLDTNVWQGYEFKAGFADHGIFEVKLPKYLRD